MATPNILGTYELLRRVLQQQSLQQQGADFGSTPNAAPENNSDSYGSPQGGLLGRLFASQAEQSPYQPSAARNEPPPLTPPDPNFRQLSRAPIAIRPRAIGSFDRADDQSSSSYAPFGASTSFDSLRTAQQGDQAAQPYRSLPDRIQAYWDHPHPYGLVSQVKEGLNAVAEAVQSSIDATNVPSTEEEAFRQNRGRERGPVAAWHAISQLAPLAPGGTGGIFARPLAGALGNGLPSLSNGARIAGREIEGPIANTSVPAVKPLSRNENLSLEPQSPAAGADAIEMARRKNPRGPRPDDSPEMQAFWKGVRARAAARHATASNGGGNDQGDFCANRLKEEQARCYKRSDEYPHWHYLQACIDRARERRDKCVQNKGQPDPTENAEWGPDEEETFLNLGRQPGYEKGGGKKGK